MNLKSGTGSVRLFFQHAARPLRQPRHLALGVVLGIFFGVVPKFSIIPWAVAVVAIALPTNLGALCLAAVVSCWGGPMMDPWFHQCGAWLLNDARLQPLFTKIIEMPWAAWLAINNTVVVGSTVSALVAAIPGFVILRSVFTFVLHRRHSLRGGTRVAVGTEAMAG